jgi:hypothetical protein
MPADSGGSRPLVVVACRVLQSLIDPRLRDGVTAVYMDYGLHRTPQLMTPALQEVLDGLPEPSVVVLGYGLCGNGLAGLKAGRHTLVAPRADDCIMLLLGSYERYMEEFNAAPGTYYLSRGWLESGSHPLKAYREHLEQYDQETADWLADNLYQGYQRIALVAPSQAELDECRPQALEVADFCAQRWGFQYQEIVGSADFVRRLLTEGFDLAESTADMLVIPPGGEVQQEMFFRR